MKKRAIFILGGLISLFIILNFIPNNLEQVINRQHSLAIQVLKKDPEHNLVLFKSENSNLIMLNDYQEHFGYYSYSTKGEEGISVKAEDGEVPFTVKVSQLQGIGNVLWGFVQSEEADKIVINFIKGEQQFSVQEELAGKGFILFPPERYKNHHFYEEQWEIQGYVLDAANDIIEYF